MGFHVKARNIFEMPFDDKTDVSMVLKFCILHRYIYITNSFIIYIYEIWLYYIHYLVFTRISAVHSFIQMLLGEIKNHY